MGVSGVDGVLMRFAHCCSPVPGDNIVGYISRGMGITVHRADCLNVDNMEPERLISVHWDGQEQKPYEAGIFVVAQNVAGVLAEIAQHLAQNNINIADVSMKNLVDGRSKMHFVVEVRNAAQLYSLIDNIRKMPSILEVVRETENDG